MTRQIAAPHFKRLRSGSTVVLLLALLWCASPARVGAQEAIDDYAAARARALQLAHDSKFTEALPLLEKLAAVNPSDGEVVFMTGFATLATSGLIKDPEAKRLARVRARTFVQRAKELGYQSPLVQQLLDTLPPDGKLTGKFSKNEEAETLMLEGEAAFVQGDLDKALANYQRALELDPQLYLAALFAGDMYNKKGQPERGGEWFARAIAINPERETAYRYWALGLVKQGKMQEAGDKFVEAFITEPYNTLARSGIVEWAQHNNVTLAHPDIDIPTNVSSSGTGDINITLDESTLGKEKDDGSAAWMMYGLVRATWMSGKTGLSEKFAKQFPNEKTYRHSLAEEMDALRLVIESVNTQLKDKKVKQLNSSLAMLLKLNEAGLLEPYILLARADKGIAQDYAGYRKANRDKLRRYMVEYVMNSGGK